jgi:hypothetical protein
MGTTALDPARLLRVAGALSESGAALRRLAPDAADDQQQVADMLVLLATALGALHVVTRSPAPPAKAPRCRAITGAQRRALADRALAWVLDLQNAWPAGSDPPSGRALLRAAQESEKARGIPRRILLAARPPEWTLHDRVRQ